MIFLSNNKNLGDLVASFPWVQ